MRKVKLQMQLSLDSYVGGVNGELDWMIWNWDNALLHYVKELTEPVDLILLGRKLAEGFIPHWATTPATPEDPDAVFAKKMHHTNKIVFSKTLQTVEWENTKMANGDLAEEVNYYKNQPGQDIIVYGGANFVSNLIKHNLIDEYHLFINPVVLANGLTIFKELEQTMNLQLVKATAFECGITVLFYKPGKN